MSVLIKGMKMPRGCDECDFVQHGIGDWCYITEQGLPCDCPLIELPDHGDLIDREALMPKGEEKGLRLMAIGIENIVNAPVVIPAERSEE